jgi:hypothetical protein
VRGFWIKRLSEEEEHEQPGRKKPEEYELA